MNLVKIFITVSIGLLMVSCENKQTLQEYYVDNQENKDFVTLDIPASMFANAESLDPEHQKTLEKVKKINVLAIPKEESSNEKIETEVNNLSNILKDEKYQLLMKFGGGTSRIEIYFTGDEEAIDEIIVFGFDEIKGMGVARLLGNNMNPGDIVQLVRSFQEGDINLEAFSGIKGIFTQTAE